MLSPTAPACVPQDHLEPVLLEHLRSLGATRVRLAHRGGGRRGPARRRRGRPARRPDGAVRTVRARYLIAADGAHSRIRGSLGIAMRGPDGLAHVVNAVFRAPLWRVVGEHRYGIYSVDHPEGAGTFLPAGRGDRWGYGTWVDPQDIEGYTPERFVRRIRAGAGIDDLDVSDRAHRRLQLRRAAGRALPRRQRLPGRRRRPPRDPARRHRDEHRDPGGHDLGWKLGWVLRGWAGPELLDSYEAERRPFAAHNVARSADPDGSTARPPTSCTSTSAGASRTSGSTPPAGACPPWTCSAPGSRCSRGPTRLRRRRRWTAGRRSPCVRLDAISARSIGIRGRGALLVRPDGAPAGLWNDGASAAA